MRSESSLSNLRSQLGRWFEANARDLPWRGNPSPYQVLLSEVILQQTRVDQGMAYYHRFLEAFPTVEDLAKATEDEVLRLWQGLGYYSRGRNLRLAAIRVMEEFGGKIPNTPDQLKSLPGVGPYTQGAILSFAYNLPYVAVDGNVYRVLSRLFANDEPIDTTKGQKVFRELAELLLDRANPNRHNQAMIELGALCCTPRNPLCSECPIQKHCEASVLSDPTIFPKKEGKIKVTERYLHYFLLRVRSEKGYQIVIRRRGEGDIWQGLYELPLIETAEPTAVSDLIHSEAFAPIQRMLPSSLLHPYPIGEVKHRLTHRLLHVRLYQIVADHIDRDALGDYLLIDEDERKDYGFPIVLDKLLRK